MELKVSKEITCTWQSQKFETKKCFSWALFLKLQTAEINFEKLLGSAWTVFKTVFNPFQSSSVFPSVESVVSVMLFSPSFKVASDNVDVSLRLTGISEFPNLAEFRDTARLMTLLLVIFYFSDYVCTLQLQTIVVKCDYVPKKCKHFL